MKIGYLSGVFDVLHVGHLNYFEEAKRNCDYLIVGINSDELVMEYKGRKPINSLKDRVKMIESLRCVDKVVVRDDFDKLKEYEKYNFNILFISTSNELTPIIKKMISSLNKMGVEVNIIPYTENISSTILKQKICERNVKNVN